MLQHLPTLMLREWMQHKRGWLATILVPPLLFLALLPFGQVKDIPADKLPVLAFAIVLISGVATYAISLLVALFQLPGLARRDAQDRSIEFWLSLPGGHGESITAIVLAHALLVPLAALLIGLGFGLPITAGMLAKLAGADAVVSVPWGAVLAAAVPVVLRLLLGALLLTLWLAPGMLALMAASAWLKRLGVPAVLLVTGVGTLVATKVYGLVWPAELLTGWNQQINHALLSEPKGLEAQLHGGELGNFWHWAGSDALNALSQLATPDFALAVALSAAAFALLIVRRGRGG